MLFHIFNARMQKVGWVDAVNEQDALRHTVRLHPGGCVQRWLSDHEQRQKDYKDEAEMWTAINRSYR